MAIPFNLDHLNIRFILENLTFCVTQISYGVFKSNFPMEEYCITLDVKKSKQKKILHSDQIIL